MSAHHSPRHSYDFRSEESIRLGISSPKIPLNIPLSVNYDKRIIVLLIITPIFIILFTAIPVIVTFHGVAADIYRFLEPVISLPLLYFIMVSSEVFNDSTQEGRNFLFGLSERSFLNIWFLIGAALYAQGAGMHSTAILAKHSIEDVITAHPEIVQQYPVMNDVLNYYQEDLEHTVGHYIYATGFAVITWAQIFAYRRQRHDGIDSLYGTLWWIAGGVLFGLLHALVAIEYPDGPLVILIYVSLVGIFLAIYLYRFKFLFSKGRRLVLQSFLIGYTVALVIILIWIAVVGGIKNRKSAGVLTH
ncbi:hypothetical protein RclHR1_07980003 [Rhizophagus clarus]|uniref:Uncharacterized protein n=1 Tax=Rhizophagus clarus TaxID=94130 RepID=A0A2Z6S153_9GLOM|nr:hypothetical protein RclHR1_07980003 [Rhizophagus clarus]GES96914.1 hypothetical protein GLOIN_2v1770539 [Rhizophagus clarus]